MVHRDAIGRVGVVTAKWAARQRTIWQQEIEKGIYARRKPRASEVHYTCRDLWEAYLRDYCNRGGENASRLQIGWNHLASTNRRAGYTQSFEKMRVDDVSTDSINKFVEMRRGQGAKGGTINRETSLLAAMFRFGTRVTPPMVRPLPAFPRKLPEGQPRQGFITDKEYAILAANANILWLRCLIACAYAYGFRKGELLKLRVFQVDLFDRWIELRRGETKNGEGRKVKMIGEVFELMRACVSGKKADDYVFTREDGSRVVDPRKEWYDLCVRAGLGQLVPARRKNGRRFLAYRGLNLHDFRRSAIRNMTRSGISETVAMKISGHKTRAVFDRYNITDEGDLEQASRLIEAGREECKTATKTDTSGFAEPFDSRNPLN